MFPEAFIFDWDSTLVDNWKSIAKALNETLIEMGKDPWTESEIRQNSKRSAREAFPEIFGDDWKTALSFFYEAFEKNHLIGITPLPGAKDLLEFLRKRKIYSGIISNKNGSFLRKEIQKLGWEKYFKNVLGATDLDFDKPSKAIVDALFQPSNINPSKLVWFVGDAVVDLECAHLANCTPILVKTGSITKEELIQWPPAKTFSSCVELESFLNDLENKTEGGKDK